MHDTDFAENLRTERFEIAYASLNGMNLIAVNFSHCVSTNPLSSSQFCLRLITPVATPARRYTSRSRVLLHGPKANITNCLGMSLLRGFWGSRLVPWFHFDLYCRIPLLFFEDLLLLVRTVWRIAQKDNVLKTKWWFIHIITISYTLITIIRKEFQF